MSDKTQTRASSKKSKSNRSAARSGRRDKLDAADGKKRAKRRARELRGMELPASDQWGEWVSHLVSRSTPVALTELIQHGHIHPLKWVLPDCYEELPAPKALRAVTRFHKGKRFASSQILELLSQWLGDLPDREPDSVFALECLAWCHALPQLSQLLSEQEWRELVGQLEDIAEMAGGISLPDHPVAHQLLNGELPFTLAYLFPEIECFTALFQDAQSALSNAVIELTDGEGLVNARHVGQSRELLACWTRCSLLAAAAEQACFSEDARNQYEWAVQQALRLSRSDGSLIAASGLAGEWCSDLLWVAVEEGGDGDDAKIAQQMFPGATGNLSDRQLRKLPAPSIYSEWAETCVMRAKWSRKAPQFSCQFRDMDLRSELSAGGRVVWSGVTQPKLQIDGKAVAEASGWSEICWFTDDDVDYLELEIDFEGGWRIQRQMLMARKDNFLLLTDAVLGEREAAIQYEHSLPLAEGIGYVAEEATREVYLKNTRPICTVVPLALPEWRSAFAPGELELDGDQLRLTQTADAQRLYAPLFIDLSARRWADKRTWRQLTIAERLVAQPSSVAAGFRVQLGMKQWMLYRSLAPRANRTLLGQNLSQEFVLARFDSDGCIDELIEIE